MPYTIEKYGRKFKVCDTAGKCFSKKGISKKMALRQRVAIALSESKKTGTPVSNFFV